MRAGLAFSAVGHMALLLWGFVLFASPKPFTPIPPDAITVDLVPAAAMAQEVAQDLELPRAERAAAQQLPRPDSAPEPQANPQAGTASAAPQPPPAQPQASRRDPAQAPSPQPGPQPQQQQPQTQTQMQQPPQSSLLVFNPTVAPVPDLPLPTGGLQNPAGGFDAPANGTAKLSSEEVAALRAHLQQCWNPPAALADAQKLRVVLRVALKPNGSLTGSPMLLEASASPHGPALVAAATNALRQCQPYGFLPADKYEEWKLLDLSFSPRGLAGG